VAPGVKSGDVAYDRDFVLRCPLPALAHVAYLIRLAKIQAIASLLSEQLAGRPRPAAARPKKDAGLPGRHGLALAQSRGSTYSSPFGPSSPTIPS
jgi:hypothetical protein